MLEQNLHLDRLRLRHLRLLQLIDQNRSLRAVAEAINLTQPAVSQMVKDLEFAFGVPLVERSVSGAKLTASGQHALARLGAGLAGIEHLAEELALSSTPALRICCNPSVVYQMLPSALAKVRAAEPDLRFSVQTGVVGDMMGQVLEGKHDCYIGRVDWSIVPESMVGVTQSTPLGETQLAIACPTRHPLASQQHVSARELIDWPWVLTTKTTSNRMALDRAFRNCGLAPPEPLIEIAAEPSTLVALANKMNVLICVPSSALQNLDTASTIEELDISELQLEPITTSLFCLSETAQLASFKALEDALFEVIGNR